MKNDSVTKVPIKHGLALSFVFMILLFAYPVILSIFHITEGWTGYIFFWVWFFYQEKRRDGLLQNFTNAVVGIFLGGFVPYWVLHTFGLQAYYIACICFLFVLLFFTITKIAPLFISEMTAIYTCVLSSQRFLVDEEVNYIHITIAYVLGLVFFSATYFLLQILLRKIGSGKA